VASTRTLLLPCAGRSSHFPGTHPNWMRTLPEGDLCIARAAASVPRGCYDRTVTAVRADHEAQYGCENLLKRVLGPETEVVVIPHDTRGPADTVHHMIERARVTGAIAIKDADSFFDAAPLPDVSFVSVSDVRDTPEIANAGAKSFAVVNENGLVVEMMEEGLASNFLCIGLYGFEDASVFAGAFGALIEDDEAGEIFVSHVMNRAIARGHIVVPHAVSGLVDAGALEDWQ